MSPYDLPDYWALVWKIREVERAGGDHKLVRLVAADWLQEHGEEGRAGYIREACEDGNGLQYSASLWLIKQYRPVTDLPPTVDTHPTFGGQLRWGSLRWVFCPLDWWIDHGPYLVRRHPVLAVSISDAVRHSGGHLQPATPRELETAALTWAEWRVGAGDCPTTSWRSGHQSGRGGA